MKRFKCCDNDEEFGKVSLFILERKRDLHLSFMTLDIVSMLYTYLTQGHLFIVTDDDNEILGASAYYHGTPERDFMDKDVAFIDLAIMDKPRRGTRLFVSSLMSLVDTIIEKHPEVKELRFAALGENTYLCRLYAKFAAFSYMRDGNIGQEMVFSEGIFQIRDTLKKYDIV
ncbi:hypothetical protein [Paenibacillus nasutitermitis]|uniref:Uncharacterized protein n=1 Tax=Paenibacillus nasutitermitis TaxID=1652958 RepID=A0A916ZIT5_9BACL|nr:hypothetical protein [Paenibacillus nasutitermitis]GGE00290.1 hypothetical protein GCM10010911_69020 [Paenibacillus nasutitermitis]